jgi:hypothetical protein
MQAPAKNNDALGTANRGNPCESGLCTLCRADCKGKCETWLSSLVGRKLLYPRDFPNVTAGSANIAPDGVGYHALRIQGYAYGAQGLGVNLTDDPDDCIFPNVSVETSFGGEIKTKCRVPMMTGALGSTFIATDYWESFAAGAALVGFPIVVGENVVGVDRKSVLKDGRIQSAPELDRRIEIFKRYYDGYGAIIIQMNVEDTRNGVAEYLIEKYGNDIILELKWGQGAKDIGGEIQVKDIEYAKFLKDRGYVVDPDPYDAKVQRAFDNRAITAFARHSRLGGTNLSSVDEVHDDFMSSVAYLRKLGYKRISLKTGAYGMEALAMSIRFSSEADLDLLTIDGAGGGTGMSPWNMMDHWGVPSLTLHAKAYEYCQILEAKGLKAPDLSFAGGLAREDHIFKAHRARCAVFQTGLHGPCPDDPRLPWQQHPGRFPAREKSRSSRSLGGPPEHRQGTRYQAGGNLRQLGRCQREGRCRRDEERPVRCDRDVWIRRQARLWPAAVHGRSAEVQYRSNRPQRPDGRQPRNCRRNRHSAHE